MRFMLMVKATGYTEAGVKFSREYTDMVILFKKSLARKGVLLAAEELQPSSSGIRILYPLHGGECEVKAGPFHVDHGLIAGYMLIEVSSEDEASEWARQMPVPIGMGAFEIEVRKLEETESVYDPRTLALEADLENQINPLKKSF
jgi:hypothetical protein